MISVEIVNEQTEYEITDQNNELIERVIMEAANAEGINDGEVVITLVNDDTIHNLNRDYRGVDRPTDVLSFAMNEASDDELEIFFEDENEEYPNMLGDIIISIPRTIEQAEEYGHSFERELGFLTVHGFLHLLGFDHDNAEDEKTMFDKQERVLENLQLLR